MFPVKKDNAIGLFPSCNNFEAISLITINGKSVGISPLPQDRSAEMTVTDTLSLRIIKPAVKEMNKIISAVFVK